MLTNDETQNANNQKKRILLPPLIITSCYEIFTDNIAWFNFQNTTPFDIKLHSVSGVYHRRPCTTINWINADSWPEAFLSVGQFNAPSPIHCRNIEDRIHLISPPETPKLEVLLENINIPAHTKCFAIMGIQFWSDLDDVCSASMKLTFEFSPTYDFTKIFSTNIFLESVFLYSPKEGAEQIQWAWDEMENMTEELKSYQLRGISSNM